MGPRLKKAKKSASPGHKLGQMVGNFFEKFVDTVLAARLEKIALEHHLYLDRKGLRPSVRGNLKKVSWSDNRGNNHDLDFVLEDGGTMEKKGRPLAFVEAAWRRYTKHSRNKTGEIEGALIHLHDSHRTCRFVGAALAGEWTDGAIKQLESHGITVLHIPYVALINSFRIKGIDLDYAERASSTEKQDLVRSLKALSDSELTEIAVALEEEVAEQLEAFLVSLEASVTTEITQVLVCGLFGRRATASTVTQAIEWLEQFDVSDRQKTAFDKFEVLLRFKDGREIDGRSFPNKESAILFLRQFLPE
ncbi:hypothetical protein BH20VER3_BH20VER3_15120 [soil metagenome]